MPEISCPGRDAVSITRVAKGVGKLLAGVSDEDAKKQAKEKAEAKLPAIKDAVDEALNLWLADRPCRPPCGRRAGRTKKPALAVSDPDYFRVWVANGGVVRGWQCNIAVSGSAWVECYIKGVGVPVGMRGKARSRC